MNKVKEKTLMGIILFGLTFFLIVVSYYSTPRYVGDTALYAQIVNNIAHTGKAEGNIFANTQDFIDRHIAAMGTEERMADEESFLPPREQSRNMLKFHCCLILYFLCPLCYVMSPFMCVTMAQSVALSFSIFFLVLLMREKKIPIPIILSTILLLISHPGWSMPAVFGAFYPERLFMGTGMYLIWACERQKFSRLHFIVAAVLCGLVGERGAIYAGMFILAHTIFYWKEKSENRRLRLLFGGGLLFYAIIVMKCVLENQYYSSMGSMLNFFTYLSLEENRSKVVLFLLINVGLFLIVALFDLRAFIIGAASMIPNLLYNVGGAEKIGWTFHYHVFYFVILMWAVTKGMIRLYTWLKDKEMNKSIQNVLPIGVAVILSLLLGFINPYDTTISFNENNMKNNIIYNGPHEINLKYILGGMEDRKKFNSLVDKVIPVGAVVSTIEEGMCSVFEHQMYLFPMGTDTADAAIVAYVEEEGEIRYYGSVVYAAGAEEMYEFDQFVVEKMKKEGYDFQNPFLYPSYGIAIIKKK